MPMPRRSFASVVAAALAWGTLHFFSSCSTESGGVDGPTPVAPSCARVAVRDRSIKPDRGAVALVTVTGCDGSTVPPVLAKHLAIDLNGKASAESTAADMPGQPSPAFLALVLDMSSSTDAFKADLIDSAVRFVEQVSADARTDNRMIFWSAHAFAASQFDELETTLDPSVTTTWLHALAEKRPPDSGATALRMTVAKALSSQSRAKELFRQRNFGGALAASYVILFTDGRDTTSQTLPSDIRIQSCATEDTSMSGEFCARPASNRCTFSPDTSDFCGACRQSGHDCAGDCCMNRGNVACSPSFSCGAGSRCKETGTMIDVVGGKVPGYDCCFDWHPADCESPTSLIGVALQGPDLDIEGLREYGTDIAATAATPAALRGTFEQLGHRITRELRATYRLSLCPAVRRATGGKHEMKIRLVAAEESRQGWIRFDAAEVGSTCDPNAAIVACDGASCGGLGCGACDDQVASCTGTRCVSFCAQQNRCQGTFTNPRGYEQACVDAPESTLCGSQCRNLMTDGHHCGGCGTPCRPDEMCVSGGCACLPGKTECDERCIDTASEAAHCGRCGNGCPAGDSCAAGICRPDLEWANWPIPPGAPTAYSTTADTVTDAVTGLVWQRNVPSGTYTWANAKTYCAGLALAGQTGWRLPTLIELESIVNDSRVEPAINVNAFPSTPSQWFWSSSAGASDANYAWFVTFNLGEASRDIVGRGYRVRCVR